MIRRRRSLRDHLLGFRVCNRGDHIQWVGLILDRLQQATSAAGMDPPDAAKSFAAGGRDFSLTWSLSSPIGSSGRAISMG
jgi:hypothetical protein